eukprot:CAMPEP_0174817900 /NCGR_PEP_ID=MMETSP1107-20130205/454_1 /TAXON_ID=36770 /ORGANISM="Paraphysomonas vestita, Strain GFlagA" /LENGTH=136 /DNA_ID=CAMNT_0016029017 /DNA_START=2903 /DNA_END=3313 /DNA_ORIENTATION=-
MTQKGAQPQSTYGRDRQNDKYNPSDNYPFATEPFGHDGSYMDESYRYQSNYKYQSNYNDSIFSEVPENYFPSQHDDQNFFRHHETFGLDASLPLSTDNLASLVAKYKSTNVSSTPNTISPSSQSSQTSFNYADIPF